MAFWFIMSGYFDVIHALMGIVSVSIVLALNYQYKKQQFFDDETDVMSDIRFVYMPFYILWLVYQILVSAIQVVKILLSPTLEVQPQMIRFKVNLPNTHAKMILGNSISLTPGTLTVHIENDEFLVHSLVPKAYAGILDDSMPHQVLKLFSKDLHPVVSDVRIINSEEQL